MSLKDLKDKLIPKGMEMNNKIREENTCKITMSRMIITSHHKKINTIYGGEFSIEDGNLSASFIKLSDKSTGIVKNSFN